MMNFRCLTRFTCLLALGTIVLLAGCSTPESRIKKNPDLFATYSPEAQEVIKNGQVNIGFTADMVTMSLGAPNRIYTRQTKDGIAEVWSYTSRFTTTDRQRVQANVRAKDSRGKTINSREWVYVDVPRETEYETIRVEMDNGIVTAIDTLQL